MQLVSSPYSFLQVFSPGPNGNTLLYRGFRGLSLGASLDKSFYLMLGAYEGSTVLRHICTIMYFFFFKFCRDQNEEHLPVPVTCSSCIGTLTVRVAVAPLTSAKAGGSNLGNLILN